MKTNYRSRTNSLENLKCIWMASNNVEYKLCDMNFNCEKCPFDKVMSNAPSHELSAKKPEVMGMGIIEELAERVFETTYPHNVTLLKNNLVLKSLFENTYYLGISPIGSLILENVSDYNLFLDSVNINKDEPIIELFGEWGNVSITSPFSFHTLGNFKKSTGNKVKIDSWFCIVEAKEEDIATAKINPSEYANMISDVTGYLNSREEMLSHVGITMNDGGERLEHLYQVIGKNDYNKLLKLLFKRE